MKMLVPKEFAVPDITRILEFIERYPFATLLSAGSDGELAMVKIPLLLKSKPKPKPRPKPEPKPRPKPSELAGDQTIVLEGHFARINPLAKMLEAEPKLSIIFDGPHDYISATWYEDSVRNVPTWNYSTVALEAKAELITDPDWLKSSVMELTRLFEPDDKWEANVDRKFVSGLARGIVGIKATVQLAAKEGEPKPVAAQFKLSQNKSPTDRQRVIAQLKQRTSPMSHALAESMEQLTAADCRKRPE